MSGQDKTLGRKKIPENMQKENVERSMTLLRCIKDQSGLSWGRLEDLCQLSRGTLSRYSRGQRVLGHVLYNRVVFAYLVKVRVPSELKKRTLNGVYMPSMITMAQNFVRAVEYEREAMRMKQLTECLEFEENVTAELARLQELTGGIYRW